MDALSRTTREHVISALYHLTGCFSQRDRERSAESVVDAIDARIDQRIAEHAAAHKRAEPVPVVGANREHRANKCFHRAPHIDAVRRAIAEEFSRRSFIGHAAFFEAISAAADAVAKLYDDANT